MTFTKAQADYLVRLLEQCTGAAYRDSGYRMVTFSDGSIGVLKCPAKTIGLVQAVRDHFAVAIGEAEYADKARKPITVPDIEARR